jgi:hypothetical protein
MMSLGAHRRRFQQRFRVSARSASTFSLDAKRVVVVQVGLIAAFRDWGFPANAPLNYAFWRFVCATFDPSPRRTRILLPVNGLLVNHSHTPIGTSSLQGSLDDGESRCQARSACERGIAGSAPQDSTSAAHLPEQRA